MKMNQLVSKYLELERFKYYNILPFKQWYFYYFLDSKYRVIRTTFLKRLYHFEILKTQKYEDVFNTYFKTGYFNKKVLFSIESFPVKYQKVYMFLWNNWEKVFYYGEIAENVGYKNGARFIGYLMKINPLPIIIPCHHVIGKRNKYLFSLGGELKKNLLLLENILEFINKLEKNIGGTYEGNGTK